VPSTRPWRPTRRPAPRRRRGGTPTATASLAAALGDLAASLTTSSGAGTAVALARAEQALGTLESRDPGLAPDLAAVRLVLARAGEWAAVPTN
jgi:hypothetical protein